MLFRSLLNNMVQCAKRYKNKEFMVVETGYSAGGRRGGGAPPAGGAAGAGAQAGVDAAAGGGRAGRDLSRYFLWPNTPEGQLQFMVDMVNIVRKGPKGAGVVYWSPERAIWNADGSAGPAVFTPDNLTKLTKRPESHVPIEINP